MASSALADASKTGDATVVQQTKILVDSNATDAKRIRNHPGIKSKPRPETARTTAATPTQSPNATEYERERTIGGVHPRPPPNETGDRVAPATPASVDATGTDGAERDIPIKGVKSKPRPQTSDLQCPHQEPTSQACVGRISQAGWVTYDPRVATVKLLKPRGFKNLPYKIYNQPA